MKNNFNKKIDEPWAIREAQLVPTRSEFVRRDEPNSDKPTDSTQLNSFNTPTIGSTRCTNFLCPLVFLLFYSLQIVNCLLRFGSFWRVFNYRKPCNLYVPKLGSFLFPGYIYMQVRVIPKLIKSYIGELLLYQIIKENIANYISQEINKCCIKCINLGSLIFNLVQLHHSYYIFLQI